jgi:LmbE family N-acetylglucosaminyl deacetylase
VKAFEVEGNERVLFAFTHPDDELALSAFISRLLHKGIPIQILWTHSTPVRAAESRNAMHALGVDSEALTFFETEDGNVISSVKELRRTVSAIVLAFRPTRVVTHAFEQGHIDHDATNLLVNLCYKGPIFEAPFYHTYLTRFPKLYCFSTPQGEERTPLTAAERKMKKRLVKMYPSQTVRRNVVVYELVHTMTMRKPPLFQFERLRRQRHTDFLQPNHPEPLASRVARSRTWHRWVEGAEALLESSS